MLARREHSRTELHAKLIRRGFSCADAARVLDALQAEGLLSDVRYAEAYVASRSARGFGPVRIAMELEQRGVGADARAEACPRDDRHWASLAATARTRRFGAAPPQDFTERARQARFLAQRGFSRAQIASALQAEADEL